MSKSENWLHSSGSWSLSPLPKGSGWRWKIGIHCPADDKSSMTVSQIFDDDMSPLAGFVAQVLSGDTDSKWFNEGDRNLSIRSQFIDDVIVWVIKIDDIFSSYWVVESGNIEMSRDELQSLHAWLNTSAKN